MVEVVPTRSKQWIWGVPNFETQPSACHRKSSKPYEWYRMVPNLVLPCITYIYVILRFDRCPKMQRWLTSLRDLKGWWFFNSFVVPHTEPFFLCDGPVRTSVNLRGIETLDRRRLVNCSDILRCLGSYCISCWLHCAFMLFVLLARC